MTGICDNKHVTHWRNTRGSRKPDTCPTEDCGLPIHLAKWDGGEYKLTISGSRSGELKQCSVCPHKVRITDQTRASRIADHDRSFKVWVDKIGYQVKTAPAGSVVCWRHSEYDDPNYKGLFQ